MVLQRFWKSGCGMAVWSGRKKIVAFRRLFYLAAVYIGKSV
jgi:hypothetical protein